MVMLLHNDNSFRLGLWQKQKVFIVANNVVQTILNGQANVAIVGNGIV